MGSIRDPRSAEARALEAFRPDLLRVVDGLRTTDLERQMFESWDRHREADSPLERSRLVAMELALSVDDTRALLASMGIMPPPESQRRMVVDLFRDGKSVDDAREVLRRLQDVTIEMAIAAYGAELAARPTHG